MAAPVDPLPDDIPVTPPLDGPDDPTRVRRLD
jgi:hypothetical protein